MSMTQQPRAIAALSLLGLLCLAGCSNDRHVFYSTPDQPTTVVLADSITGRTLWEKEVPVQRKLVLDLDREGDVEIMKVDPRKPATKMRWKLYDMRSNDKLEDHEQELPGTPIVMRVKLRAPEMPDPPEATPR